MIDLIQGYTPHQRQTEFHRNPAKYCAFIGGVGSGKTFAGFAEGMKYAVLHAGSRGMVVSPTYPMLKDAILPFLETRLPRYLIREFNKQDKRLVIFNGSVIYFRSADKPDRLRGPNLAWFWIDEAALCAYATWKIMLARLRQEGFPLRGWITTTPKGRNWVYQVFIENASPQHAVIRATSYDNPYLPSDFVEDLKHTYDDKFFRQEVLAEFVTYEGLVYPEFSRERHTHIDPPDRLRRVVLGVDYGYTNPSAVLVIGVDEFERVWVVDEWYKRHKTQAEVADVVAELAARYGAEKVFVDPSAASLIAEIQQRHISVEPANNDVLAGISKIRSLLQKRPEGWSGIKILRRCPHTIAEFESYELEQTADGFRDKPKKVNDHAMDALRYAVMGLFGQPRVPLRYHGEVDPVRSDLAGGVW